MPEEPIPDYENMEEVWLPVVGAEGKYEVSSYGKVKSLKRVVKSGLKGVRTVRERILKQRLNIDGYPVLTINRKGAFVHRLVAFAFIPNPNRYLQVNHKTGDKTDARVWMIEWCSQSMNAIHSFRVLGQKANINTLGLKGCKNYRSKHVSKFDLSGNFIESFESIKIAHEITGVNLANIASCVNGVRNKAGGFKWHETLKSKIKCQNQCN